jgi:hypothetical protein
MAEVEFPLRLQLGLDSERRPVHDDPKRARSDEGEVPDSTAMNEFETQSPRTATSAEVTLRLRKLKEQLTRDPLDEIAALVQTLTYGAMIELSDAIWKVQSEGSAVTRENLPALLHRWSQSHLGRGS